MYVDKTAVAFCCLLALGGRHEPIQLRAAPVAVAAERGSDVVVLPEPPAVADAEEGSVPETEKQPETDLEAVDAGPPTALRAPAPEELNPVVSGAVFTPLEIQCRAAQASSLGNLLRAEQAAVTASRHAGRGADHASRVRKKMLGLAAEEARNRDAGAAILLYWSLAEAMHSRPILDEAVKTADLAIADHATLTNRGLEIPVEKAALLTRRLALEDSRLVMDVAVDTLSEAIQRAADLPCGGLATVRPGADAAALEETLDGDALVAEALARRPELRMLRMLQSNLDTDTAPVARTALALASPALGVGSGAKPCGPLLRCLTARENQRHETATVARQLRQLRHDREAAVADEVRRAARECGGNASRARVARDQLEINERALADLQEKLPSGGSDTFSLHVAELEVASARRSVIERLAAWERSRASLWQAQGILAEQCGYGGH